MPYAIEFYFDRESEKKIGDIWQDLVLSVEDSSKFEGYRPHITLAVYDSESFDLKGAIRQLDSFSEGLESFGLELGFLGIFPEQKVVFLGPKVSRSLLNIHYNFHKQFKDYSAHLKTFYSPDNWIPHCTIAFGLSEQNFRIALEKSLTIKLNINIVLSEISIVKVLPEKATEVHSVKLPLKD